MGQRGSKHQNVQTMTASFSGGLNLHDSAINIQDNQLRDARNFYYADRGSALVTRPGIKPVLDAPIGKAQLQVKIYPVGTGGWKFTGETAWREGGDIVTLDFGTYYIEFEKINGYTPEAQTVQLVRSQSVVSYYPVTSYLSSVNDVAQLWVKSSSDSVTIGANPTKFGNSPSYGGGNYAAISFKLGIPKGSTIVAFTLRFQTSSVNTGTTYGIKAASPGFVPNAGTSAQFRSLFQSVSDLEKIPGSSITTYFTTPDIASLVQPIVSDADYTEEDYITLFLFSTLWVSAEVYMVNSVTQTYVTYSYY